MELPKQAAVVFARDMNDRVEGHDAIEGSASERQAGHVSEDRVRGNDAAPEEAELGAGEIEPNKPEGTREEARHRLPTAAACVEDPTVPRESRDEVVEELNVLG